MAPLSCRVCGLQELGIYDFEKGSRFRGPYRPEPSADLCADDLMEVALIAELLHHGADAKHTDELVSCYLQFASDSSMDNTAVACAPDGLKVTYCSALKS